MSHAFFPNKEKVKDACHGFLENLRKKRKEEENKVIDRFIEEEKKSWFRKNKDSLTRESALAEIESLRDIREYHSDFYQAIMFSRGLASKENLAVSNLLDLAIHGDNLYISAEDFALIKRYMREG